ncbi:hypothetical protein O0L34_g18772 [Tuta absoluta]|nr:hypothetical protein O0L34_g18772 [Tuta absoluta]
MMLTIHGLPMIVKYQDVKALIREKCNITDYILDNLVSEGDGTKKVRIGLADEREGTYFIKCLDGFRFGSNMLRIVPFGKPQPSNPQQNFEQPGGGYTPRSDYPNQSSYGQTGRPMGGPDMMRQDPPRQDSWGPGNSQWGPSQHQGPSQVGQPPMQQNTFNNYQQGMNAPYGQEQTPQGNIRQPYDQRDQFHGQSRAPQNQGYGHPKNDIPSHGVSAAQNLLWRPSGHDIPQMVGYSSRELMYSTNQYDRSSRPDRHHFEWICNPEPNSSIGDCDDDKSDDPDSYQTTEAGMVGEHKVKCSLSGSAKRRLAYWLTKGYDREEAELRALHPLLDFPEYREDVANGLMGDKKKHQTEKRPKTSESSAQPCKKSTRVSEPSLSQAGSFKVGIRDENTVITAELAAKIEGEIVRLVSLVGRDGPNFKGFTIRSGVLVLTCLNVETRNWLEVHIHQMKPWEGSSLSLIDASDLPKQVYVVAYLPNMLIGPDSILECLHAQNKEVGCNRWRLINSKTKGSGQIFFFGFDNSLLPNLQRKNFVLHLGMRTIQFKVKGRRNETVDNSGTSGEIADGASSPTNATQSPTVSPQPGPSQASNRGARGNPRPVRGSGASRRLKIIGTPVIPTGRRVRGMTFSLRAPKKKAARNPLQK